MHIGLLADADANAAVAVDDDVGVDIAIPEDEALRVGWEPVPAVESACSISCHGEGLRGISLASTIELEADR